MTRRKNLGKRRRARKFRREKESREMATSLRLQALRLGYWIGPLGERTYTS